MPTAVIMPKFEMAQETGKVGAWLKAEGEAVKKGEPILEVETDKVTQEVEAPADGILRGIAAEPGDVVPIGQTIAFIAKPGEPLPGAGSVPVAPPAGALEQPVSAWPVASASPLAMRLAGSLGIDLSDVKGSGPRGQVTREDVAAYADARRAATPTGGSPNNGAVGAADDAVDGRIRAAPAARRLARELGVNLALAHGTGPADRIQPEDVRALAQTPQVQATMTARSVEPVLDVAAALGPQMPALRRLVPLTSIRRTIADRMTASVREAPQFNVAVDADMTRSLAVVEDLRNGDAIGNQPRVTLTALLIKACAWALSRHPGANAAYLDGQIAEWDEVNVGVAVATEAGLIVPVICRADRLGLRAIAAQLADLTTRARAGRLKIEDIQGGTFTLSNLGMFGIDQFTAILNPPQAAILAVGRVAKRPVVVADDRIEVRPVTTLTLTADHRVLDGASAAQFLATIQRALEHPGLLLA